jgi:hypothetical protein
VIVLRGAWLLLRCLAAAYAACLAAVAAVALWAVAYARRRP